MEHINMEQEISFFNLDKKWNDYIGAQKEIISKLKDDKYFECSEIINRETGMRIRISPKGIKETIGKGNRFQYLPKRVKMQKVATIRKLPVLIEEGYLMEDIFTYITLIRKKVPNYSAHPKRRIITRLRTLNRP